MPASPLRAVIIGSGMIGTVHLRAARDSGATVIGVLGSSAARSAEVAVDWGVEHGYADIEAVIADAPDVVHIATPNHTHHRYALALIDAGINVICEKPLGVTATEAEELATAAGRAGVVATVPFVYRYHPLVREIRARRIAGEFGDLLLVHGSYLQDWLLDPLASSWRVDTAAGGPSRAFADIGSHWCDLVEFVSGERFADVSATMTIAYPTRPVPSGATFGGASDADAPTMRVETEDTAVATFRTERGITANTVISQVSAGRKNRLWFELDGSAGSVAFDGESTESVWLGSDGGSGILHRGEGDVSPDQARLNLVPAGHAQGYTDAFALFVGDTYATVRGEHREGLPTFADGVRADRIIDAVLDSAASSTWTNIPS